jgi:beta-glucanase (GH16 family)
MSEQPLNTTLASTDRLARLACLLLLAACGGGEATSPVGASPAPSPAPVAAPPAPAPVAVAPAPPAAAPASPAPAGYRLVWSDEFDTPGLPDATRWDYDTFRNRPGWFNNERQYYSAARSENSVVQGGRLLITARREALSSLPDWGGQAYSSVRLITRGKAAWTYGFFEIRAKMPCGTGTWPAIWMLGTGGVWPDDGEIDILEHVGRTPGEILGTVHTTSTVANAGGSGNGSRTALPTACTAFHDFQLHWTADEIAIGVNGNVYHRYRNPRTGKAAWPFDAPQYLLLNIAVGGTLGGAVDDSIFPRTMEVEHVRVWQAAR